MKRGKLKKGIAVLLTTAIAFSNFSGIGSLREVKAASTETVVEVENSGFESTTKSNGKLIADSWSKDSSAEVVSTDAKEGNNCLKITNSSTTMTQVTQELTLSPNTEYVLTGYIKGENISGLNGNGGDYGDGATIDLEESTAYMLDHTNNWKKGTFDWKKVTVYFVTTSTGKVTLRCRLGHYFGGAKGTAYFDKISIKKKPYPNDSTVDRVKLETENVGACIKKDIVESIGMDKYQSWINAMQETYEAYADLTGSCPYNGDVLNIIDTDEPVIQQYGAIANYNPILLNGRQKEQFEIYAEQGYMNFGYLHEFGHSFDKKANNKGNYGWNFNGEFWANTKMLYVLDQTDDITINMNGVIASNSQEMAKYYKEVAGGGYDNTIAKGVFNESSYDALTYVFIKLVETVGWDTFKATFRQYVNENIPAQDSTFKTFRQFLKILQKNYNPNGTEVMDCIGTRDYNIIRNGMQGGSATEFDDYISYSSVVQGESDFQEYVFCGEISGTEGKGRRIEQFSINTPKIDGVLFKAYINGKWTEWKTGGSIISGNGGDIQAIKIKLSGELAEKCDVYYRTHNRHYGWLGWTGNGIVSGTKNMNSAVEGYQIQLVEKGTTIDGITNDTKEYFKEELSTTTIYYKGYENPYIHYKVGDGSWTKTPGIKMEANSDVEGFDYAITIDLNKATSLTACFNDGNGKWDNNSRQNYSFGSGYYTFSNGKITRIDEPEKELEVSKLESSLGTKFLLGKTTQLSMEVEEGDAPYTYSMKVNGEEILPDASVPTTSWMPSVAGTYTVVASVTDAAGMQAETTMTIDVVEPNSTTIYYKGYENPNIHYKIGDGSWTSVPGVKMESNFNVDGYNYAITIDLGEATSLTACFNDGNGTWDNNKRKNYVFGTGYYTYSNQEIKKIEKPTSELRVASIESSRGDVVNCGSSSDIKVNAVGGEGKYTYTVRYLVESGDAWHYMLCDSEENEATFAPEYTGEITLFVIVRDEAGNVATGERVIEAKEKAKNQVTIYYEGYENPNIHYKIGNGKWTSVPGIKMEESSVIEGYPYAVTIDLGEDTELTACFNDGNGTWDNNKRKNYVFGVGEYTYSDGTITKID